MTQSDISSVLQNIEVAKGLPNHHYIDETTFEEEKHAVLFNNWAAIGFGKDIPEAGDTIPIDFLGLPLFALRDKEGNINIFQNTCRHRGMILVDKPQKLRGPIRCPYHSWSYDLQGNLKSTPMVGGPGNNDHEDVDRCKLGLFKIRSYIWNDIIFVNINNNAEPFEKKHAHLLERWREFDQPFIHGGESSSFQLDVKANWKLAIENYCESYHLPWVHPELNTVSKIEDHYNISEPGLYSGQGSYVYRQIEGKDGLKLNDFENLSNKWDKGSEYISFFPNVLLGIHRDYFLAVIIEPKSAGKTTEHASLYYAENEDTQNIQNIYADNARFWKQIFLEDRTVVEGMQRGRHGVFFDGGKFTPLMDEPTHIFHHWVASQIMKHRSAPTMADAK